MMLRNPKVRGHGSHAFPSPPLPPSRSAFRTQGWFCKILGSTKSYCNQYVERSRWLLLPIRTNEKAVTSSSTTSGGAELTSIIIIINDSFIIIVIILVNITIIFVFQYQSHNQRQKRICTSYFLFQGITLPPLWALDQMQRLMKNLYWRWNQSSVGSLFKQQCWTVLWVYAFFKTF